jgi:hypothetical protein
MFIILITIISINHNRSSNPLFLLSIYAEPDDDNKEKEDKEIKIDKDKKEQDQTKDKDKDKDAEKDKDKDAEKDKKNDNKIDNSNFDPAYRSFFPIKRIVIPEVYETIPKGQTYRFNIDNPNDKVQVDKTDKSNVFTQQNLDGSWRIDYGRPRIDIHTKVGIFLN